MLYSVEITEYLQRTIKVEAVDEAEALIAAKQMYRDEIIVLGSQDYIETDLSNV